MFNFKYNPFQKTVWFLALYAAFAVAYNFHISSLIHLALTVGLSTILFYIFSAISKKKKDLKNTIITALILFLLLHYGPENHNWIITVIAVFVATASKFFLEYKFTPIINPAVFGILIAYLISLLSHTIDTPFVAWWGVAFKGYLSLGLIALWIVMGFLKWNKYRLALSFLIFHAIFVLLRGESLETLQFILSTATIYFYATIMLSDPKTSPLTPTKQIIYGLIAAIFYNLFAYFSVPMEGLLAISIANLYNFGDRIYMTKKL